MIEPVAPPAVIEPFVVEILPAETTKPPAISAPPFASSAPVSVVMPVTPSVPPTVVALVPLPIVVAVEPVVLILVGPSTVVVLPALPIFVPAPPVVLIFAVPFNVEVPSTFTAPLKSELPFVVNTVPAVNVPPPTTAVPRAAAVIEELGVDIPPDNVVRPVTPSVPTSVVFPSTLRFASRSVLPFTFNVPPTTVALVPEPILVVALPVLLMSVGPRIVVVLAALPIVVFVVLPAVLMLVAPLIAVMPFNVEPFVTSNPPLRSVKPITSRF